MRGDETLLSVMIENAMQNAIRHGEGSVEVRVRQEADEVVVDVRGRAIDCGHFLPEEAPEKTLAELRRFFEAR